MLLIFCLALEEWHVSSEAFWRTTELNSNRIQPLCLALVVWMHHFSLLSSHWFARNMMPPFSFLRLSLYDSHYFASSSSSWTTKIFIVQLPLSTKSCNWFQPKGRWLLCGALRSQCVHDVLLPSFVVKMAMPPVEASPMEGSFSGKVSSLTEVLKLLRFWYIVFFIAA